MREAQRFIDSEKGVASVQEALAGARDIIAERVNDDALARGTMRAFYARRAVVRSKVVAGKEAEGAKFKDYFSWSEPAGAIPSHRLLAMRRGEAEGVLTLRTIARGQARARLTRAGNPFSVPLRAGSSLTTILQSQCSALSARVP